MAEDLNDPASEKTAMPKSSDNKASSKSLLEKPNWSFDSILNPAKILAWIGLSTGSLGIILAVIGFLALGAHDNMLGIPGTYQKLDYIKAGGLFFSNSVIFVFAAILTNKWCWLLLGILLIISMFNHHIYKRYQRSMFLFDVFVLLFALGYVFYRLGMTLQNRDVLLDWPSSSYILHAILIDDQTWLNNEYGFLAILVFCLTMVLKRLDQAYKSMNTHKIDIGRIQSLWKWMKIPAIIILIIIFYLLPQAYGVLTFSYKYPQVLSINPAPSDPLNFSNSRYLPFLINQDDKFLILYDPFSYTIINLSLQSVNQYKISAPRLIFNPTR
ncbi:MAG: hypothetical protein AAB116_23290 [Candidatus Poribacteria bacterium]